jgi:hypothetical protein
MNKPADHLYFGVMTHETGVRHQGLMMRRFVTTLLVAIACVGCQGCDTKPDEAEQAEQERQDAKVLDDFYELEWVDCVNQLGLEQCRIIQETGFRHCYNKRTVNGHGVSRNDCIEYRFSDRLKLIKEGNPKPTLLPEALEPSAPVDVQEEQIATEPPE